jgi:RNA polymerase sigma-70 factor (ECF subfamily)
MDAFADKLARARAGDRAALDALMELVRPQLQIKAAPALSQRLRVKASVADIVQDALFDMCRHIDQFAGETEAQFYSWADRILARRISKTIRRFIKTDARNLIREVSNDPKSDAPDLVDNGTSPTQRAVRMENERRLNAAMDLLPDVERLIIQWRDWQNLDFATIGQKLQRSENAAQKLHARALVRLGRLMRESTRDAP